MILNKFECKLNYKIQRHLHPQMGVNKPFQNVSCQGHRPIQNFFQRESTTFCRFFTCIFFPAELILVTKTTLGGVWGMLPQKNFENLHTVIVILALFKQFSGKVCSYFWPLTLSASSNIMHFVSTVLIMRA